GQVIGLLLILVGSYFALSAIVTALGIIRDPAGMGPTLESMAKALGIEQVEIPAGEGKIPVGRLGPASLLPGWHAVVAQISVVLIGAGGKLVAGVFLERREFLGAMKEFLITVRSEGISGRSGKP